MPDDPRVLIASAVLAAAIGSLFAAGDAAMTALPEGRLAAVSIYPPAKTSPFVRYGRNRERILSRWLVGRVLSMASATALLDEAGTALAFGRFRPLFAVVGAVVLYGTFTEILNTLARRSPEVMGAAALRWLRPLEWLVMPLAEPLALLGRFVAQFAPERLTNPLYTESEINTVVNEGQADGTLDVEPAQLIRNVLEFKDLTARDVMVPRTGISGIEVSAPLDEVRKHVAAEGHSRYPVYREVIDDIFGLLYAKDLFRVLQPLWLAHGGHRQARASNDDSDGPISNDTPSRRVARLLDIVHEPVKIVPESRPLSELLRDMRQGRQHMAIVVDEFGGTSGVVTLEDVIEEIVGDIRDEHDDDKAPIVALPDGRLLVDAAVLICDLSAYLGWNLDPEDEYDSLGGMMTDKLGHVPAAGATMRAHGVELIVRDADEKHITKVEIVPIATLAPAAPNDPNDTGESEARKVG